MLLVVALFLYLLVVILTFLIAYISGIKKWSAIILGLLIGFLFLNIFNPPTKMLADYDGSFLPILYLIIEIGTPIVLLIYIFVIALSDRCYACDNISTEQFKLENKIRVE